MRGVLTDARIDNNGGQIYWVAIKLIMINSVIFPGTNKASGEKPLT